MSQIFTVSFILIGLPIIFSLNSLFSIGKIFVYGSMALILLTGIQYKKFLQFKWKINFPLLILLFIVVEFTVTALLSDVSIKQIRDLFIILWLFAIVFSFKRCNIKKDVLLKTILILSTLSIVMIYISTPISLSYWALHGERIYIGDTKNPNLVAWAAAINMISIFFFLLKYRTNIIKKLFFIIMILSDLYLFFLAQSKSSIIGFGILGLFYLFKYKYKLFLNRQFFIFFIVLLTILYIYNEEVLYYFNLIYNTFISLIYDNDTVMSASIRQENFQKSFELISINNIFGYGINTFRMDSPILQVFIDFGNILGIIFSVIFVLVPLYEIFKKRKKQLNIDEEFSILIYLFYFPNLFFHGTPYEWSIWLPVIIFYMFNLRNKICNYHR